MEAVRTRTLPNDAVERGFDRAAGDRPIPGNRIESYFEAPDAFDAMLDVIARAQRWIHFDNYIFREDVTGRRFAEALAQRARDGVSVRISSDWIGSFGTSRRFWRKLRDAGAVVHLFNPPHPLHLATFASRNHRKLVVADGRRAVIGGLCIGDEWAGDQNQGRLPWRDTAVLVEGPAAAALDRAFARTWEDVVGPLPPEEVVATVEPAGTADVRVLAGEPTRERAYRVTEFLLATAADRVWITDAYLVAPHRLYRYLMDAAREGVDVRLLVPGTSDLPLVRNLTRFGYRDLLRAGVRIFEWAGPMLHAKSVVADHRWVRVGSSNLNHSSLVSNYELDVLIDSVEVADQMEAQFRRDLDHSSEVTLRRRRAPRPLQKMVPEALRIAEPGAPIPRHRKGIRERNRRSVLAVRTLAASARLAVFGPLSVILALVGLLFFIIPGIMAIVFGLLSGWLALVSGAEAVHRRTERRDRG